MPAAAADTPPRAPSRWWAVPLALLTLGLALVTWGAVVAFAADPDFMSALRLVIEAIATGVVGVAAWRVARPRPA